MTGHPLQPGRCAEPTCGRGLDSARKTYCPDCARQRRRDQNARHDAARRQRDRDRRLSPVPAQPPPGSVLLTSQQAGELGERIAFLWDAADLFLSNDEVRARAEGRDPAEPEREDGDEVDQDALTLRVMQDAVDVADLAAELLRALPEPLRPTDRRPLPGTD